MQTNLFPKSISLRPESANLRNKLGHWEGDTVRENKENDTVVTLLDRHSRFPLCKKVPHRERDTACRAVVKLLKQSRQPACSVTFDLTNRIEQEFGAEFNKMKFN